MDRNKVINFISAVQIVIGLLLLTGTVYVATSVLPKIRGGVFLLGEKLADAAEAVRADNESYCAFATNVFTLGESIKDVAEKCEAIGSGVKEAGRMLHFEIPILNKINNVGDRVCDIGNDILNTATAIRQGHNVMEEFRNNGHLKTCRSINDAAEGLKEVSKFMQNGPIAGIDGWYICLLGTLLSLLFVMNGVILLLYGIRQKME